VLERAIDYPGSTHLLLRRTYGELEANHIMPLLRCLPPGSYTYTQTHRRIVLVNGSTIVCGYCADDRDVLQYQGQEYDTVAIDEATQWRELWWHWLIASCRTTRTDGLIPLVLASANPGGIGHGWVKRLWVDHGYNDGEEPADYAFVPAKVADNPSLSEADPAYVRTLEALPDDLRRAWLEGDWDVFAGQMFSQLRRGLHGFTGAPPPGWTFRSLDYGEVAPASVHWWRVDYNGDLWGYRELYGAGMLYPELAAMMVQMSACEEISYTVASPDIFATSKGTGVVGSEVLAAHGIPLRRADDNRVEGWRHLKEWIAEARIHVSLDSCPNWWRTLPAMVYDTNKPEDMDKDGEDHAAEETRYAVQSRPRRGGPPERKVEKYSGEWLRNRREAREYVRV